MNVGYYEFPYIYTARDGHAAGSGARLVRLLLERAGYRPAFRALPSARLYLGLQDGSVALWAGAAKRSWPPTPSRRGACSATSA